MFEDIWTPCFSNYNLFPNALLCSTLCSYCEQKLHFMNNMKRECLPLVKCLKMHPYLIRMDTCVCTLICFSLLLCP